MYYTPGNTFFMFKEICERNKKCVVIVKYLDEDYIFIPKEFLAKFACNDNIQVVGIRLSSRWGLDGWGVAYTYDTYHSYNDIVLSHRGIHWQSHYTLPCDIKTIAVEITRAITFLKNKIAQYECIPLPDDIWKENKVETEGKEKEYE